MKKWHLKNSKGFTLIEVMVVAGMMAGLGLVGMQLTKNLSRSQKNMSQKNEMLNLENQVSMALRDQKACRDSIAGLTLSLPGAPVTQILTSTGSPVLAKTGYGSGDGKITVTNISIKQAGATQTILGDPTKLTSPAIVQVTFVKGDNSAGSNVLQQSISMGGLQRTKDFPITVIVNQADLKIVDCYANDDAYMARFCSSISGTFNIGTGRCENIAIADNNANSTTPDAIISNGSLRVQGGASDLSVGRNGVFNGQVSIGTGTLPTGVRLNVAGGTAQVTNGATGVVLGGAADALAVTGNSQLTGHVQITGAGVSLSLGQANPFIVSTGGAEKVRIDSNGRMGIGTNAPGFDLDVRGNVNVTNGSITIVGQDTTSNGAFGVSAIMNEVPTKKWVEEQVGRIFYNTEPSILQGLATTVAGFVASNTMDVIKSSVCQNSYVKNTNFPTGTSSATYASGVCTYDITQLVPPDCTVFGRCNTLYANSYIHSGGGLYANNYIQSGGTIWASNVVYGLYFFAFGTTSLGSPLGICNYSGGCHTAFAKYRCPNGYFMYGIANGYPQCSKAATLNNPSGPVDTTPPYNY